MLFRKGIYFTEWIGLIAMCLLSVKTNLLDSLIFKSNDLLVVLKLSRRNIPSVLIELCKFIFSQSTTSWQVFLEVSYVQLFSVYEGSQYAFGL